jgi:hypothetical protein
MISTNLKTANKVAMMMTREIQTACQSLKLGGSAPLKGSNQKPG